MMQFFDYFIKKMLRNMTKKFLLLILTLIKHGITQMYASLSSLINISLIFILFYFFFNYWQKLNGNIKAEGFRLWFIRRLILRKFLGYFCVIWKFAVFQIAFLVHFKKHWSHNNEIVSILEINHIFKLIIFGRSIFTEKCLHRIQSTQSRTKDPLENLW